MILKTGYSATFHGIFLTGYKDQRAYFMERLQHQEAAYEKLNLAAGSAV